MPRASSAVRYETVADLLERLGDVPARRIRLDPRPGTATENDAVKLHGRTQRLYELVDGVLVEKVMGYPESALACVLIRLLGNYLERHNVGILAGADGPLRLMPGLVRLPDISFVSWDRLPGREVPAAPIADVAPDLAVEILSAGNTKKEMSRKLREYFLAEVRLVWLIDPARRSVQVYTAPDQSVLLTDKDTLDGGAVLPGLALSLAEVFAKLPRRPARKTEGRRARSRRKPE